MSRTTATDSAPGDPRQQAFPVAGLDDGKLGLALSGGGLRAALFHIGVLARLAERDVLRHVAVISTVSGGAIVGAFYYLKVKQLLEGRRPDGLKPSREAYRRLVEETERDFVAAAQKNIRLMTFADRRENARMLANATTPSHRLADLFDTCFFEPITGQAGSLLRDLPVRPVSGVDADAGETPPPFAVPRLMLNCATLNTGHLFQFAGSFVGEPSISTVRGGTSAMPRLQRLHMDDPDLTPAQRQRLDRITLGEAVAASCCVPGLLDPLTLDGLYTDDDGQDVTVRLVDGGVFDNQGLVSLFEEGCTHFIVSDASDPLEWQAQPPDRILQVAMRANDVMMDRIRIDVMRQLRQREPGRYAVFTLGTPAGNEAFGDDAPAFVRSLKAIRTDLDAFSDIEAMALMYHGYMVSAGGTGDDTGAAQTPGYESDEGGWRFSAIETLAAVPQERQRVLRHLEVAARPFLKVFFLGQALPWVIAIAPTLIPLAFAVLLIYLLPPIPVAAWVVLGVMAIVAVALAQNARIVGWLDQIESFRRARLRLAAALRPVGITMMLGWVGALASWINLRIFNPLFLKYGRLPGDDRSRSRLTR